MWLISLIIVIIIYIVFYMWYSSNKDSLCDLALIGGSLCTCPDGYDQDIDGQCYSCPSKNGYKSTRNANAVTSPSACTGDCNKMYTSGFEDGLSGECYSCPTNFNRSVLTDINANNACVRDCPSGTFSDPTIDGCWQCPSDYPCRTISAVDSGSACGKCGVAWGTEVSAINTGSNISSAINNGPMTFAADLSDDSFTVLDPVINAPKNLFDQVIAVPKNMLSGVASIPGEIVDKVKNILPF
jgi:hypothetical protein